MTHLPVAQTYEKKQGTEQIAWWWREMKGKNDVMLKDVLEACCWTPVGLKHEDMRAKKHKKTVEYLLE